MQSRSVGHSLKTIKEQVKLEIEDYLQAHLKLSVPAVVTKVSDYETQQCVDVKTVITNVYQDGTTTSQLNLQSIFVKLQEANGFKITLPIEVGDKVTLHYTSRHLNNYLAGDGSAVSEDIEQSFGNKDCYVTHGFGTRVNNQSPSQTDIVIEGNGITIKLKTDGSVTTEASETNLNCPTNNITGNTSQTGDFTLTGTLDSTAFSTAGVVGVTGVMTSSSSAVVTNGLITAIT